MSKRPNFGLSSTAMAGAFALQGTEGNKQPAKPWDGNRTGAGPSKKPFEFRGSNTDYGQAIGFAAKEKELAKDLQSLDWELKTLTTGKQAFQSDANLKPNLFMKKKAFNDTVETKAAGGSVGVDWDLPEAKAVPARGVYQPSKEKSVEASEWNLGKIDTLTSKARGEKPAVNRQ